MFKKIVLLTFVALIMAPVMSDSYRPNHMCSKPYKPYQFQSEFDVQSFQMEVERYESCINEFVEDQMREMEHHREAAEEAIEEWNNFVKYDLD